MPRAAKQSVVRGAGVWLLALVLTGLIAGPAAAHGFGQRFVLPLPLWLWVVGAGLTIVLTFAVMSIFVRRRRTAPGYARFDLTRLAPVTWLCRDSTIATIRVLAVAFFGLAVAAGFLGSQNPYANILPTLAWVIWWVGFAFVCALVGDLWALVNPFATVFGWAERALSPRRPFPLWRAIRAASARGRPWRCSCCSPGAS